MATGDRSDRRRAQWADAEDRLFDAVIVGGGVNGASIFAQLALEGRRVLLLDRGDFASGTSQASAMMIWGGLLYLRYADLRAVRRLCVARERWLSENGGEARPCRFRILPGNGSRVQRSLLPPALVLYWLMGGARRSPPQRESDWPERAMLRPGAWSESFVYEDAMLSTSDARTVLRRILRGAGAGRTAANYAPLVGGGFDRARQCWRLEVQDRILDCPRAVRARWVINAAGVWTDSINRSFRIHSPYKHLGLLNNPWNGAGDGAGRAVGWWGRSSL